MINLEQVIYYFSGEIPQEIWDEIAERSVWCDFDGGSVNQGKRFALLMNPGVSLAGITCECGEIWEVSRSRWDGSPFGDGNAGVVEADFEKKRVVDDCNALPIPQGWERVSSLDEE